MEFPNWGKPHESQRGYFAASLYEQMKLDSGIWLVCFDLGYKVFDRHFQDYPDRTLNVGASEQAGMGVAIGLALEGKKVFTYTISSFYLRCAENIALYLANEQIPVKMVGSGRDGDYAHDGFSHHGKNAQDFIENLGITSFYPGTKESAAESVGTILKYNEPVFISLRK